MANISRLTQSSPPRRKLVDYTQRGKYIPQQEAASASATSICTLLEGRKNSRIKVPTDLPSMLNVSFRTIDTHGSVVDKDCNEPVNEEEQPESVDFFLKIPSTSVRRERKSSTGSDSLRERFQPQPVKLVNRKLIETILNEPSTRSQRSNRRARGNAAA